MNKKLRKKKILRRRKSSEEPVNFEAALNRRRD
jgi:hypothetical protein